MNLLILYIISILALVALFAFLLRQYIDRKNKSIKEADVEADAKKAEAAALYQNIVAIRTITELMHAMPVGVKVYDASGKLISSNLRDREIFGVPETVDLMKFTVFTSPVLPKALVNCFSQQLPYKDTIVYDFSKLDSSYKSRFKHIEKTLTISGHPIMDIDGNKMEKYVVVTEDETETVALKHKVDEVKEGLRFVASAAGTKVWGYDVKSDSVYEIRGEIFGLANIDMDELLQRVHRDDREQFGGIIKELCYGKIEQKSILCRFMNTDEKEYKWVNYTLKSLKDKAGAVSSIVGMFIDMTEIKQLEDENKARNVLIENQEKKIDELTDHLDIALGSTNSNLFKFDLNTGVFSYIFSTGIYQSTLALQDIYDHTDKETAGMMKRYFSKFRTGELKKVHFTYPHTTAKNALKYSLINLQLIFDKDGKSDYVIGTQHDTTKEHAMQKRLKLNILRTRMVLEASGDEYWEFDAMRRLFKKMSAENTVERVVLFDDFVNSVNAQDITQEFKESVISLKCRINTPHHFEVRERHSNGDTWHNVVYSIIPVELDSRGYVLTYACVKRDVTEQVHMRDEMAKKNVETELALGAGHIMPFTIDVKEDVVSLPLNNMVAMKLFGSYPPQLRMDKFVGELAKIKGGNALVNDIARLTDGDILQARREATTTDRRETIVYLEISLIATNYNCNGVPETIVGLVQDVTEHRQLLISLNKVRKQAEESNRLKSVFLANMSHEIRTPLNAIVGFSELLIESDNVDERREYSRLIETNNDLLLHLIGDILDLSKIEAGMMVLRPQKFDLAELFDQSGKTMQQKCQRNNPNVTLTVDNPYKSCLVNLDPNRLTQVWINFTTNSIKYTVSGSIVMGYKYADKNLHIYVTDTGIGIADDKRDLVFKRFCKLDDFAQGTGLGLSIVKAIVEQCGGRVGFTSVYGKGSTFYADIPCEATIIETKD